MADNSNLCRGESLRLIGQCGTAAVYHGSMADCAFFADMVAVDPPWRQGNLSYWSRQAGTEQRWSAFVESMSRHFTSKAVYLKVGVPESSEWIAVLLRAGMSHLVWWETTYYAGRNAQIVATRDVPVAGIRQEQDSRRSTVAVAEWAWNAGLRSVADPCVGKGVMLSKFQKSGIQVVGVELVEARARLAAKRLCKGGLL